MNGRVLDSQLALEIVRRMGESGLPPEHGIEEVNVGTDSYLQILDSEYLAGHLAGPRGSTFKLVQGTYGAGKTHFLYCLRACAARRGYLTALVTLTGARGECPFDSPLHVYQAVARTLTLPAAEGRRPVIGWTDILRDWVTGRLLEGGKAELGSWLRATLERAPFAYQPYRTALARFLRGLAGGADEELAPLEAWLLGQPVPVAEVRAFGVYEAPREQNAFAFLRSLVQAVRELELPGTALLFDEGEKQLSFARVDAKSTREVLNNLRETIDLCGRAELPGTLFAYAVTPDFVNNVLPRYPALQQRLLFPVAAMSVSSPLAPVIDLENLDLTPAQLLTALGERLTAVYRTAYGWGGEPELIAHNLGALVEQTLAHQLEVGHRRVFVKSWLRLLDEGRRTGMQRLTAPQVWSTVRETEQTFVDEEDEEFVDA